MAVLAGSAFAQSQVQKLDATKRTVFASDGRKYVITDSGIDVATEQAPPAALFWLNQDELVFVSRKGWNRKPVDDAPPLNYQVLVWNISLGTTQTIRDFGSDRPAICLNDGYLRINVRTEDGRLRVFHGHVDRLREDSPNKSYSNVFCRAVDELPTAPSWMEKRAIIWLPRLGQGFIDFGDRQNIFEDTPVRLYKQGAEKQEGIELPLKKRGISVWLPYFPFKDAFFVESRFSHTPPPADLPYSVYWLSADGSVVKILDIPWGPWRSAASFWSLPTKVGVIGVSHNANVRNERDLAHAGMYLFDGRDSSRLVKAWVATAAASPDGCKMAFSHASIRTRKTAILQIMELCK